MTDFPIDRIAQTVQPSESQRAALDELQDASRKADGSVMVVGAANDNGGIGAWM